MPTVKAFKADKPTVLSGEKVTFTITADAVTDGMLKYALHAGAKAPTPEEMKALAFVSSNKIEIMPIATAAYWAVVKNERTVMAQDVSTYAAFNNKVDITVKQPIDTAKVTLTAPVTDGTPGNAAIVVGTIEYTAASTTWMPSEVKFAGGKEYAATVTLTAADTHLFFPKAATAGAITADGAKAIKKAVVSGAGPRSPLRSCSPPPESV